ncbi:hypothetical protein L0U85_07095 [Glycomyces sp. L485]|uniref:hypothetical protein n=1 Tax=Glycomyces sp. L485 TaxID=2909235 RepID=UPI001F4A7893|nr:hypothetical protein [Glycomyces sp. L485]MCH7230618.1 hypothetical protein [Glycomyces sp. L485]
MSVFWTELRRSPAKWWAPVIAAVIGAYLVARYGHWEGVWTQASTAVQVGTGLAAPFMTAAAAWTAYRRTASRLDRQAAVSATSPWKRELVTLAAVLSYAWVPVLAAYAVVTVMTVPATSRGTIWPTYILLALSIALLAVAFGYFMGRALPSPFTVPAASLFMMILVFLGDTDERFALMTLYGYPDVVVSWSALAARAGLALSILALALAAGAIRDWHRSRHAVVRRFSWGLVCCMILLAATMTYTAGPLQVPRYYHGNNGACTDTYPMVCVWQEHEKYLPMMADYVERFNELDEFLLLPNDPYQGMDQFWEEGMRGDVGDQLTFFGGGFGAANGMVAYAMDVSGFPGCEVGPEHPDAERLAAAYWQLSDWLTAYIMEVDSTADMGVSAPGLDSIDEVLAMPEDRQFEWAHGKVAELRAPCDV